MNLFNTIGVLAAGIVNGAIWSALAYATGYAQYAGAVFVVAFIAAAIGVVFCMAAGAGEED